MKDSATGIYRLPIKNFDARLSKIPAIWLLVGIWAPLFLVNHLSPPEVWRVFVDRLVALALYFIAWLGYPLILTFVSMATRVTPLAQRLALLAFIAFAIALFIRPADGSVTDQWFAAIGLLSIVTIEIVGAQALLRAERQYRSETRAIGTSLLFFLLTSLMFFFQPLFGIIFLHWRYQALVKKNGVTLS